MPSSLEFLTSPAFLTAFATALAATAKVFVIGAAGFFLVYRRLIAPEGLVPLSQVIAFLTLPCQIFDRFATGFDPQTYEGWWKLVLISMGVTISGIIIGKAVAKRHKTEEATLLIGYQNAGFFVLPMLQALLPASQYEHASVLLFIFVIPFNASLWPVGSWVLLHKREFNLKVLLSPPTLAVLGALFIFGLFHDAAHSLDGTVVYQMLFGGATPGAIHLIGDLTVPLATIVLGGSIAATLRETAKDGLRNMGFKKAAVEVAIVKLMLVPLLGYFVLKQFSGGFPVSGHILWLMLMLQFASPPAVNISVFCQQHGYKMKLIPAASLLCYMLSMLTVPFWVALIG